MKHSIWLLLACSLAGAIPLHKGESWTWLVVNRETNARQWRSAMVLDSAKHDSGVVWRVQARDSLTKGMDTGSILVRPDGSQNWWVASKFIPWEPQPLPAAIIGKVYNSVNRSGPLPWGSVTYPDYPARSAWKITSSPGLRTCGDFPFSDDVWWNCPDHIWDDSVGILRARIFGSDRIEDWVLQVQDGKAASIPSIPIKVPDAGSVLVWRETTNDSAQPYGTPVVVTSKLVVQERTWEILQHPSDSSGWVRLRIREVLRSDSSSHDSTFDLRLNPMTQERIPSRGNGVASPDEGWWLDWADSLSGQAPSRFRRSSSGMAYRHWSQNHSNALVSWMKITSDQEIDSLEHVVSSTEDNGGAHSWSRSTFTRVRISMNGKVIRSDAQTGVRSLARRKASLNLLSLAKLHPTLVVRWRDARGRSGQILASDASRSWFGVARGVLFLSAALPDGSRWCGTYLPEMR